MMTDRSRVIDGLRNTAKELAMYAPMKVNGRCQMYFDMAIHMLKEQEPTMFENDGHHIRCTSCGEYWCETDIEGNKFPNRFCPNCGRRVKCNE